MVQTHGSNDIKLMISNSWLKILDKKEQIGSYRIIEFRCLDSCLFATCKHLCPTASRRFVLFLKSIFYLLEKNKNKEVNEKQNRKKNCQNINLSMKKLQVNFVKKPLDLNKGK